MMVELFESSTLSKGGTVLLNHLRKT